MRCVYIICEKEKKFTNKKNKCNALYIGESKDFEKRKKTHERNEIYERLKIELSTKIMLKPLEKNSVVKNIKYRLIKSFNFKNDDYRKEVEGYLIKRLNPLLNKSKRKGVFEKTFKKFKKSFLTWTDYENEYKEYFFEWYDDRTDIGNTETIYHCRKRKWFSRYSSLGQEAIEINSEKKFKNWKWKNKLHLKFDLWRTDKKKWKEELKYD